MYKIQCFSRFVNISVMALAFSFGCESEKPSDPVDSGLSPMMTDQGTRPRPDRGMPPEPDAGEISMDAAMIMDAAMPPDAGPPDDLSCVDLRARRLWTPNFGGSTLMLRAKTCAGSAVQLLDISDFVINENGMPLASTNAATLVPSSKIRNFPD